MLGGATLLLVNLIAPPPLAAQQSPDHPSTSMAANMPMVKAYSPEQRVRWQRLFDAYRTYVIVKYCSESRKGYLIPWVNDDELDRARRRVKKIEDEARELFGDELDADGLFRTAEVDDRSRVSDIDSRTCHSSYLQMLDTPTASGEIGLQVEKDF